MESSLIPTRGRPEAGRTDRHRYPAWQEVPTRFGDMDSFRHVNNVAVNRLYEEARIRFMDDLARRRHYSRPRILVVQFNVHYLAETGYPEPVHVGIGVARLGGASFTLAHVMYQEDRCVGVADTTLALAQTGGERKLPDILRDALETMLLL